MDFAFLHRFLETMETNSKSIGKRHQNRKTLDGLLQSARRFDDLYGVVRLLIPHRDVERQHYNMKENALAVIVMHALGIAADSQDGLLLRNWKRAGNFAAGDFARIVSQVISKRQCRKSSRLTITDLNSALDRLARASKRKERVDLFRELMEKTTAVEMKWILRIILKDMKIGFGENSILDTLHDDARAMMATCVDLKLVCLQFHDRSAQPFRRELIVGKVLKSQHSKRMNSVEDTWLAMKYKKVLAEWKFDGDRMQVHRDGENFWFWSRNGKEHQEYTISLHEALRQCLQSERCVLDGELLVWDDDARGFKTRTKNLNHDVARAARKGLDTSLRVCFIIFDILYDGEHGSVMHLPLWKRRDLLKHVFRPDVSSQVFSTVTGKSEWSSIPSCLDELKDFFWRTVETGNEGIVVKDLGSQWCPDNRDGRWCKVKPDYVFLGSDLDLLIIGGYYGTGSHGGKIVSYLLALVDVNGVSGNSARFISICRCGQGLSDEELSFLNSKLSPYFVMNEKGGKPPSTCGYVVTNSRYECPDVWILKPEMSVVLQISSEKRIYPNQTFKAGWTFRFPRVVKVRYDKCWHEALNVKDFEEIVKTAKEHGNSMLRNSHKNNLACQSVKSRTCNQSRARRHQAVLPHLQKFDVSHVQQVDKCFEGLIFYFCSNIEFEDMEYVQVQIKRCGGRTVPDLLRCVTHVIALEDKGIQFKIAVDNDRDIVCFSWIVACIDAKKLLPISPRHYLFQSHTARKKLKEEIDNYGDPWFETIGEHDLAQVFKNIRTENLLDAGHESVQRRKAKFAHDWHWGLFHGCDFYFHKPIHSVNPDSQLLAMVSLKRLALETEMLGASISCELSGSVTHVIIYAPSVASISIKKACQSFPKQSDRELLQSSQVSVVSHLWLEECAKQQQKLSIKSFLLHKAGSLPLIKPGITSMSNESESKLLSDSSCQGKGKTTTSTDLLKTSQSSLSFQEGVKFDRIEEKPYLKLPKRLRCCSPQIENRILKLEVMEFTQKIVSNDDSCNKGQKLHQFDNTEPGGESMSNTDVFKPRHNCLNSKQKILDLVWGSQRLQDIAQVYLGCSQDDSVMFKGEQSFPSVQPSCTEAETIALKKSNYDSLQLESKKMGGAIPASIPKRRFTAKDWI